jgi:hypothetical protein
MATNMNWETMVEGVWEEATQSADEIIAERKRTARVVYQRRWRANSANREAEKKRLSRARAMKMYRESLGEALPVTERVGKCAFCRHRTPKFKVQRLRPTEAGFKVIEMPYCGEC